MFNIIKKIFYSKTYNKKFSNFENYFINKDKFIEFKKKNKLNKEKLKYSHHDYISNFSVGTSAASLEVSAIIYSICEIIDCKNLVDFGSGYTSYVLRKYEKDQKKNLSIYSIDSSVTWLDTTKNFIKKQNCPEKKLITWSEFENNNSYDFDLAVIDIRPIQRRVQIIEKFLKINKKNTVLIIDDLHKDHLKLPILKLSEKYKFIIYDLKDLTLDNFGRYAGIIKI